MTLSLTLQIILLLPIFHSGYDGGIYAGLLHPILGIDHLLAMVSVGLLSAQMGGRALWTVPVTFVSVMALGGLIGIVGIPLPFVEYGIALSVILLGIAIFYPKKLPVWLIMIFVGLFALFHGHAHGAELPEVSETTLDIAAYIFGFLLATAALHLIGALIGQIANKGPKSALILRYSGLAIALIGVVIFIRI